MLDNQANQSSHQKQLKEALINEVSVDNFYNYSDSFRRVAQYKQALKVIDDGLNEFPLSIRLKLLKAQICFEMSDLNQSLEIYQSILDYTQDNSHAIKAMAQIQLEQKKYSDAESTLKKLNAEDRNGDAWVDRMLNKINVSDQNMGQIHSKTLAKLYEQQGFKQEAQSVYQEMGSAHNQGLSKLEKLEICLKRIQERKHTV